MKAQEKERRIMKEASGLFSQLMRKYSSMEVHTADEDELKNQQLNRLKEKSSREKVLPCSAYQQDQLLTGFNPNARGHS